MKESFLEYAGCLSCSGDLAIAEVTTKDGDDIRTGSLSCSECGATYPIEDGIVDFLVNIDPVVRSEIEGWEKMYSPKTVEQRPEWVLSLPYLTPEIDPDEQSRWVWKRNGDIFHQVVSKLGLKGGERVLELGASTCWATQQWAEYGCESVALDVTKNLYYGMKSGQLWMDDRDSYFERLLCDFHKIPFKDSSFDIVFVCGAAHHSSDIDTVFKEVGRILKKGGRFICISEPLTSIPQGSELAEHEIELGINENIYSIFEWRRAIKGGGMKPYPFIDYYFEEDKKAICSIRKEKGFSPNPIKRVLKSLMFAALSPIRLRINAIMLNSELTSFNSVSYKK